MDRGQGILTPLSSPSGIRPTYGVTFVLSGGAARGALQVGMLQALVAHGIVPTLIVGTSVGAFNGAYLACRPTSEGMQALEDIWLSVHYDDIFSGGLAGIVLNLVKRQPSLYNGDGVRRLLERTSADAGFTGRAFEDLVVPLAVVATNLTRGQPVIFERGPILPALLASSAIPAILPPVELDGDQYVDGGLLDNVGLRVAAVRGARRIYVLDTSWQGCAEKPATTLEAVIGRSLQVVMAFHLQSALEAYATNADVVVLRSDERSTGSGSDFNNTTRLIHAGREIAERVLASPQRESERAIQRGRAVVRPVWAGGPRPADRGRGQVIRHWVDAAAASAYTSIGVYMRHVTRAFGGAPSHDAFMPDEETLDTPHQQAS
jgi:NTE family protein